MILRKGTAVFLAGNLSNLVILLLRLSLRCILRAMSGFQCRTYLGTPKVLRRGSFATRGKVMFFKTIVRMKFKLKRFCRNVDFLCIILVDLYIHNCHYDLVRSHIINK